MLPDLPSYFVCPTCLKPAHVERERGFQTATATAFDEVRVEYDYEPVLGIYQETARVRDGRLLGCHDVYTLQSPLVRDRAQAVRVAETVLRSLNAHLERRGPKRSGSVPSRDELVSQGWTVLV
jgi:hypothetical protein